MIILVTVIFAVLSAFCYRIGGMSKVSAKQHFPWFPQAMVASWFRDANCTLLTIGWALICLPLVSWWWYILAAGAQYGLTTTYFDDAPFNWKKPDDNFYLHGLGIRLALGFVCIPAGLWLQWLISSVVLAVFMGVWCMIFENDFVEEYGRGGAIQATLPLLLIKL